MCNLYHVSSKGDAERYIGRVRLPDYDLRPVGPFGQGVFVRPADGSLLGVIGQWGLIRPGSPKRIEYVKPKAKPEVDEKPKVPKARSTNNARLEGIETKPTFMHAWKAGQRCLIPAAWYQEPNWETKKNVWWQLKRADGLPWMLAGLWSEWIDHATGEVVPNFTMITRNCNEHPLLNRLHKPDPYLKPGQPEDKRAVVHVEPERWDAWLHGADKDAREVLAHLPPPDFFDQADKLKTDAMLAALASSAS